MINPHIYAPQRFITCALTVAMVMLASSAIAAAPNSTAVKGATPTPASQVRPIKAPKRYTMEQFMATTNMSGNSISADEKKVLVASNQSGVFNLYEIPIGGGKPLALTQSKDTTFAISYFPDDERVLFTRDRNGDENNHLFVRELNGTERDLTPGDKLKAAFIQWKADGSAFFVMTNERDSKFFDVYRYDARTYERKLVFQNDQGLTPQILSDDEQWIAFGKTNTTNDSDVYVYHIARKEMKHITKHEGNVQFDAQTFDPASKRLIYTSNEVGEFARLRAYDLASGQASDLEKADWDIAFTYFSRDGRYRVTGINQDASTVVRLYRVAPNGDESPLPLPKLPAGEIRSITFSKSGSRMSFYLNGDRSPSDLYLHEIRTGKTTQLSRNLSPEIDPNDLVESTIVRFRSFDGLTIPNVYYRPKTASPQAKVPAVIFVHGGPGGQTRRGYSAQMQALANAGYAVLGINNRGSSGYGKTFFAADDGKHGREPLWDCIEAKTWLAAQGDIDHERIGIMGGSYGGYMTLAALAFRPEAFKVGVNIFGVSNWIRTLESIPPYWESFRKALYVEIGDPVKDREFLVATSPLFHAKEIRKPLLVIQGANDPRVIKPESDDIVAAVKKNNVPVEYVVFDDEGHGFSKKKNSLAANKAIIEFLDKYLKGQ
jgi:dipeptidyl aminopeptidase/acylaminoacyl peptidase